MPEKDKNQISQTDYISGILTSLALLRLRMFSAMYLMLSIACLISGDTTEKATTVLTLCALSGCDIFPRSGVAGVSFPCRQGQGQGHFLAALSSTDASLPSPNSRQLREPPPTCWRPQTDRLLLLQRQSQTVCENRQNLQRTSWFKPPVTMAMPDPINKGSLGSGKHTARL